MSSVQQAQHSTSHEHRTAWHSTARLHNTKQYSVNSCGGLEAGTLEITNMVALIRLVHIVHWASVDGDLFACASQLHVCYIISIYKYILKRSAHLNQRLHCAALGPELGLVSHAIQRM